MLSFSEILLILLIAVLILKPEDLPTIMRYFLKLKKYVLEIGDYFKKTLSEIEKNTLNKDEISQINDYVKKINELGLIYDGEYNVDELRKYYLSAVKKIKENDKNNHENDNKPSVLEKEIK